MTVMFPAPPADAPVPARTKNVWRSLAIGGVFGAAVGALVVLAAWRWAEALRPTLQAMPDSIVLNTAAVLGAWFVSTAVHELGHLVGGFLQGFRFLLFVVGPLKIDRHPDTDRIQIGLNTNLELAGGMAGGAPVGDHRLLERTRWLVIGGPLASLLLALLTALLVWWSPTSWWSAWVLLTGLLAGATGLLTLIPMQNGNFVSDGRRFLDMWRDSPVARRDAAMLFYGARDRAGQSVIQFPREQVLAMLEPADGSVFEVAGRVVAYLWLIECGDVARARAHLGRAAALADGLPFHLDAGVAMEEAFTFARYDGDATKARARTAPFAKRWSLLPVIDRYRLEAAIALAEGRPDDVRAQVTAARAAAARTPQPWSGSMRWSMDRIDEIETRLR